MVVLAGEATVAATLLEDLVPWAEGPGTLLRFDTLGVVWVRPEGKEAWWAPTALKAKPATDWAALGRQVVVFTGESTGCGAAAQNVVTSTSGV